MLSASCAHLRVLRSFELKQTKFDVVECKYANLKVLRPFESVKVNWEEEDMI